MHTSPCEPHLSAFRELSMITTASCQSILMHKVIRTIHMVNFENHDLQQGGTFSLKKALLPTLPHNRRDQEGFWKTETTIGDLFSNNRSFKIEKFFQFACNN